MIDYIAENNNMPLIGVEIGAYRGDNALRMFKKLPMEHLYLIDPYECYDEYGFLNKPIYLPSSFEIAMNKLGEYQNKITPLMMRSSEAVNYIPDNLDFIYIDGNHTYNFVKEDIENYYPKLKPGGILGGHDIAYNPLSQDIRRAVEEFAISNNLYVYIAPPEWWLRKV